MVSLCGRQQKKPGNNSAKSPLNKACGTALPVLVFTREFLPLKNLPKRQKNPVVLAPLQPLPSHALHAALPTGKLQPHPRLAASSSGSDNSYAARKAARGPPSSSSLLEAVQLVVRLEILSRMLAASKST